MAKLTILVLGIHAEGDGIDGADYAIILLNDETKAMLKRRMELVKTLKESDKYAMSINFFGEPDLIISTDQFDEIFADQIKDEPGFTKWDTCFGVSQIVEIDKAAFNKIKSQTEIDDGLRLGACDLRVYDDNFKWYLYEKHSGIEMFTDDALDYMLK